MTASDTEPAVQPWHHQAFRRLFSAQVIALIGATPSAEIEPTGTAIEVLGHHEINLPLLRHAILRALATG